MFSTSAWTYLEKHCFCLFACVPVTHTPPTASLHWTCTILSLSFPLWVRQRSSKPLGARLGMYSGSTEVELEVKFLDGWRCYMGSTRLSIVILQQNLHWDFCVIWIWLRVGDDQICVCGIGDIVPSSHVVLDSFQSPHNLFCKWLHLKLIWFQQRGIFIIPFCLPCFWLIIPGFIAIDKFLLPVPAKVLDRHQYFVVSVLDAAA